MSINSKNFPKPNQVTPFCFGEGKGKKNFHSTKSVPHFFFHNQRTCRLGLQTYNPFPNSQTFYSSFSSFIGNTLITTPIFFQLFSPPYSLLSKIQRLNSNYSPFYLISMASFFSSPFLINSPPPCFNAINPPLPLYAPFHSPPCPLLYNSIPPQPNRSFFSLPLFLSPPLISTHP